MWVASDNPMLDELAASIARRNFSDDGGLVDDASIVACARRLRCFQEAIAIELNYCLGTPSMMHATSSLAQMAADFTPLLPE
jgi:hypothetical protein